jgi:uncharacterized protein
MRLRDVLFLGAGAASAVSAGMLIYGALVESKNIRVERRTLRLPRWPERLRGYRIAVIADLHLRDEYSLEAARRAVSLALDEEPDMVALLGDYVGYWKPESEDLLRLALEPLLLMEGRCIAVPGNHEYWLGDPDRLGETFDSLNIRLLRNASYQSAGITWIGVDSAVYERADLPAAFNGVGDPPRIVLWHEPDAADALLPGQAELMLSGHSHGGQFRFPGGFTPMHTKMGGRYVRGFHPEAPVPVYVSRGVGTTGPPCRFNCPPEVSLLTLEPA